jgi:transcription elongation factor GreB
MAGDLEMNKAFTRESEDDEDDLDEHDPAKRLPVGTKNYMTPAGYARLKDELDFLLKKERPRMVDVVSWAASNGDRSENGDYIYGKRRLREIDRRIRYLNKRLASSQVVDPTAQQNRDQVFFGATVVIADAAGVEQTFSIVGIDEADAGRGLISWTSPLALALIKNREGDTIRFNSPSGWREIDIIEVRYELIEIDPGS